MLKVIPYSADLAPLLETKGVELANENALLGLAGGILELVAEWTPLAFETQYLGISSARLDRVVHWPSAGRSADVAALFTAGMDFLRSQGIEFLSARLLEEDQATVRLLVDGGFCLMESLLTFTRRIDTAPPKPEPDISLLRSGEEAACLEIIPGMFGHSRYHQDSRIGVQRAERLKRAWVENNCRGRADTVFVAHKQGRVAGFNSCLLDDGLVIVDLMGVAEDARHKGVGKALIVAALVHYAGRARWIFAGTSSRNRASVNLYGHCGFGLHQSAVTLHAHL